MRIRGYAFQEDEKERQKQFREQYKKIKHLGKEITIQKQPRYGHTVFRGSLDTPEAQKLSCLEIALIADHGNLCFGGQCTKTGNTFYGLYWVD
jgi:hypothetical protein